MCVCVCVCVYVYIYIYICKKKRRYKKRTGALDSTMFCKFSKFNDGDSYFWPCATYLKSLVNNYTKRGGCPRGVMVKAMDCGNQTYTKRGQHHFALKNLN